ncbi:DNA polymerase III subunit epsilon [Corynebacterium renale]|uniref:3'-5' exonuclease n=1 Tax=Corynebacterium renale TaxID=1724 RepID=UPI000DA28090|nr:3'-5' exonuclease [Corynebacterium renale]SQG64519.1 DNA polymerase III subunit epsilon [Corynebacterium renale]STC95477.1 DNA polymerase III subunit epsilon [Corynebacterium renale]
MLPFNPKKMLAFDLETTSAKPTEARIVTSALVRIDPDGAHPEELLADPGVEIPEAAQKVHGISTEYAREHGAPHEEVLAQTIQTLYKAWEEDYAVVAYNANYDLTVLHSLDPTFTVNGVVFDPYVVDKVLDRYRTGKRTLTDVCAHYNVRLDNAHEATADALAAARIAWMQARKYPDLLEQSGEELMEFQAVGYYEVQEDFKKYLESRGKDGSNVSTSWPIQS